ncbi:MAG: Ala-tRNA(Pro) deacylase [Thermoleophilaceae bacterium]|jgi:prolyl-tRNA editing enzyme YbaK/EbsC (Cys-tRNA(Pro) deacylase)|nr:Ala-tRNA(Pro) deacylase [Thermoleophilaceae bacterium]
METPLVERTVRGMPSVPPQDPDRPGGFEAVRQTLDTWRVDYAIVRHEAAGSALEHALASGLPACRWVETLGVWAHGHLHVVAFRATQRLDMRRVRNVLGDPAARLASLPELARELPDLDAGALPPFGPPAPPLALIDRRVLSSSWVLANGGDHRHSLRVSPLEIVRLSRARVVDIADGG